MRVAVPLLRGVAASQILVPVDLLTMLDVGFQVELVGLDRSPVDHGAVRVSPHRSVRGSRVFDLIVVPTLGFDVVPTLDENIAFTRWLRTQWDAGADVASWCTGTFLLAAAGLLNGRRATTHWVAGPQLAQRHPEVSVQVDRMLVDEGSVITSGGATTVYLLLMYLVKRYVGTECCSVAARECLIDLQRPAQSLYDDGRTLRTHEDRDVQRAQDFASARIRDDLSVQVLAREAGLSTRSLSRRFKAATGLAPAAYVQKIRVDAARRALVGSAASFETITERVGYVDPRAFRRLFKRVTGLSPTAYRELFAEG